MMKKIRKVLLVFGVITGILGSTFAASAEEISVSHSENEEQLQKAAAKAGEESKIDSLRIADVELVSDGIVTGETYPGVTFDNENNILTLNNADIKMKPEPIVEGSYLVKPVLEISKEMFDSGDAVKINLVGHNRVSYTEEISSGMTAGCMIDISYGEATFTGEGSLDIDCGLNVAGAIEFWGNSGNYLTVESGQINITSDMTPERGFGGITLSTGNGFMMYSGELNIKGEAVNGVPSQFRGIYTMNPSKYGIHILGGTVNIEGPDYCSLTQWGMDSQCGDMTFRNANVKIKLGDAYGASFALLCGNRDNDAEEVYPGKITVENARVECVTGSADQTTYSSYFFDLINKENLHFYVGDNVARKEVSFEEAFEWGGHWYYADRYESIYRCFTISSDELEFDVIPGDINGDASVDLSDLMLCLHHVSGSDNLTGDSLLAADLDGNGIVDLADLMQLLHQVSGS